MNETGQSAEASHYVVKKVAANATQRDSHISLPPPHPKASHRLRDVAANAGGGSCLPVYI